MEKAPVARPFPFPVEPGNLGRIARSGVARLLGLSLIFGLAAVVQTWPLAPRARDSVPTWSAWPLDSWQSIWNLWWVKHALVGLQTNPFHTDLLFFPQGADLYLHTQGTVNGVFSIPLQIATGNVFLSWNVVALIFFVLSALGAYALSHRVSGSHAGALISGYIFAFAPFTFIFQGSQWHASTTWMIPLFALFVLRIHETGRLRDAVVAGIVWAVLTYNFLEYAIDAGLFLGLFLVYWSVAHLRKRDWATLLRLGRGLALVAVVWLALSAPLLIGAMLSLASGDYLMPKRDDFYSADLLAYVTPSPLWGPGTEPARPIFEAQHHQIGSLFNTLYLGIVPIILSGLALFSSKKAPHRVLFWAAAFIFFLTLSLGPYLYVGGSKTISIFGSSFSIPLPYQIFDNLPVVGERRVPSRMIVFGILGLSVLAGRGFAHLMSLMRGRYRVFVPILAVLVPALLVLEYWNPPMDLSQPHSPPILQEIRDEPGEFSVLDVPWGRFSGSGTGGDFIGGSVSMYYQAFHNKPTFGGYVARLPDSQLRWVREGGLWYFARPASRDVPTEDDLNPAHVRGLFRQYSIGYVIVHSRTPDGAIRLLHPDRMAEMDTYLRNVAGLTPVYADYIFTVYRNDNIFTAYRNEET